MKLVSLLPVLIAMSAPLAAQSAPRVAATLPAAELATLERIRKDVWVHWFTGDTAALRRVLTPELVAISPDEPHWQSLGQTLAGSAGFRSAGGRFVSVSFDSTTIHRFGDVVVMFSHYAVVMQAPGSTSQSTQKGRATELFVRRGGRWLHTSWHLDVLP